MEYGNTGNFSYPIDLVFDAFGDLVVADASGEAVQL